MSNVPVTEKQNAPELQRPVIALLVELVPRHLLDRDRPVVVERRPALHGIDVLNPSLLAEPLEVGYVGCWPVVPHVGVRDRNLAKSWCAPVLLEPVQDILPRENRRLTRVSRKG